MVDPVARKFFRAQQENPRNNVCADSGEVCPTWASVSHGIYISIGASGIHRSLGVKSSFVLSTTMDSWKPMHLRLMEIGGNQRFQEFMDAQGVPRDMPIRVKYQTRAAEWYRINLRAEAEGREPPCLLPPGTGHVLVDTALTEEQILLNSIFAQPPLAKDMTTGGVPIHRSVSRKLSMTEDGSKDSNVRKCTFSCVVKRSREGATAAFALMFGKLAIQDAGGDSAVCPPGVDQEECLDGLVQKAEPRSRSTSPGPSQSPSTTSQCSSERSSQEL